MKNRERKNVNAASGGARVIVSSIISISGISVSHRVVAIIRRLAGVKPTFLYVYRYYHAPSSADH